MSKTTSRRGFRRMIAGWPMVIAAAERVGCDPDEAAKRIAARMPWNLIGPTGGRSDPASIAYAVEREARMLGRET